MDKPDVGPQTNHEKDQPDQWGAEFAALRARSARPAPQPQQPAANRHSTWLLAAFEEVRRDANSALSTLPSAQEITYFSTGEMHTYRLVGPDGQDHRIDIARSLPGLQGAAMGSLFVRTSASRAIIYLVPNHHNAEGTWRVAATGATFSHDHIRDLFLHVFAQDPDAAARLFPRTGASIFETALD